MIRLIGAILIAAASAAWGISGVVRLRRHAASLNAVVSSIELLKSEICDRLTQMPEVMELLRKEAPYPAGEFFGRVGRGLSKLGEESLASVWQGAVSSTPELLLTPQESLTLAELGYSLGKYSAAEQRGAMIYAQKRMEAFAKKAEAERDRDSKVQAFLGLASGILVIIVLL